MSQDRKQSDSVNSDGKHLPSESSTVRNLSHPSTLLPWLEEIDAAPRKGLSQNFLIDANIVRNIVQAADLKKGDHVLEIGPGPGALTQEMLAHGAHVIAIEKDAKFARALSQLQIDHRLQVIEGDFLEFSLKELEAYAPLKVVANLPYHISSPILVRLCQFGSYFSSALLMVQKEFANRMLAKPGTKEISSFTIFLNNYCEAKIALKVSRRCFYPVPNVDSCVVELQFHAPRFENSETDLALVRKAYQQRRKMLRSTLSIQKEPYASMRPEMLSIEDWKALLGTV